MSYITDKIKTSDAKFEKIRVEEAIYERNNKKLSVTLLMGRHFTADDERKIAELISKELPFANVSVRIRKTVCAPDVAKNRVLEYIRETCAPVKERVSAKDVILKVLEILK